jgi:hypothetical protein
VNRGSISGKVKGLISKIYEALAVMKLKIPLFWYITQSNRISTFRRNLVSSFSGSITPGRNQFF